MALLRQSLLGLQVLENLGEAGLGASCTVFHSNENKIEIGYLPAVWWTNGVPLLWHIERSGSEVDYDRILKFEFTLQWYVFDHKRSVCVV